MTQNISKVFTSAQIFYLSEHRNTKKNPLQVKTINILIP